MDLREVAKQEGVDRHTWVEVYLQKGVKFDLVASSIPCAHKLSTPTDQRGEIVSGYVIGTGSQGSPDRSYWDLSQSPFPSKLNLGGVRVYGAAVHSIGTIFKSRHPEEFQG